MLGGHAVNLSPDDAHLGVSESIKDTSKLVIYNFIILYHIVLEWHSGLLESLWTGRSLVQSRPGEHLILQL